MVPGSPVVMELVEYKNHSKHFQPATLSGSRRRAFLVHVERRRFDDRPSKAANLHTTSPSNAPVFIAPTTRMFFVTDPQGFWLEFMDNGVKKDPTAK